MSKLKTLMDLAIDLPVPPLTAIGQSDFSRLFLNEAQIMEQVRRTLLEIKVTAGAFLDIHLSQLPVHSDVQWSLDADFILRNRLLSVGINLDELVAVRSSADVEDGEKSSFAGIFTTVLNVHGLEDLKNAIVQVWFSSWGRAAVLERIQLGDAAMVVDMTVIMQRMVRARLAGVAFSHDPISGQDTSVIEAVPRLADAMVSGSDLGYQARVDQGNLICAPELFGYEDLLHQVAMISRRVSELLKRPADIEWVADEDRVWLVQARPITNLVSEKGVTEPVLEWTDLYSSSNLDLNIYAPLPSFAQYFRAKRLSLANFSRNHGVAGGKALLVRANRAGVACKKLMSSLCSQFERGQIVLDVSSEMRQLIIDYSDLPARLTELVSDAPRTLVIREFITGDYGLITKVNEDGSVICEYSVDGLLAINRGTASTYSLTIKEKSRCTSEVPLSVSLQDEIFAITRRAKEQFGPIQLEWVLREDRLLLIDFSSSATDFSFDVSDGIRLISPGYAVGECVRIDIERGLEELSISARISVDNIPDVDSLGPEIARIIGRLQSIPGGAIVVSPRPYAALAAVLPYVKGFVFERAAVLCHLSILLRERGIPAIESLNIYSSALAGERVVINVKV